MRWFRRTPRIHRRDWRRLWRYCRCGHPWGCLGTLPPTVPEAEPPMPVPPSPRPSVRRRVRPANRGGYLRDLDLPTRVRR
ncbi:hypothetical protein V1634_22780 [Plantactinospora veratri]|uniref:Uncharacterized protein n=1 Tax=Plantactinospora veratri TaxID=1436122 RepID=A0ABU7SJC6_9ACTN